MNLSRRQFITGGMLSMTAFLAACGNNGSAASATSAADSAASAASTTSAADGLAPNFPVGFGATVTDAGQYVTQMTISFQGNTPDPIDKDAFQVYMTSTVDYGEAKGQPYAYYDATVPLTIERIENDGSDLVTFYFKADQAPTLTWTAEGRNYPAIIELSLSQTKPITVTTPEGDKLELTSAAYITDPAVTSYKELIDPEVMLFEGVQDEINYQFHKGTNDKLIVWFHGNGEGDFPTKDTNNNIAQILANRGGVAWVSDEAQAVFGDASVMAFQAPSMWYLALKDNLLEACEKEIQKVIKDNGIKADEVYVAGCSAGGFMSTRMIIAYPDLFKAAMISCPALDAANVRSETDNATPTDDELKKLIDSKTGIWLVQGETDSSVDPELCSKRIWDIVTAGIGEIATNEFEGAEGIASGFTTHETVNGKYRLSLYKTFELAEVEGLTGEKRQGGKIKCVEDLDQDGTWDDEVLYNDHWSWIYTLRNNPQTKDGTHIWEWAAAYKAE